jgi:capsular polysaccharide biosynthesis protein
MPLIRTDLIYGYATAVDRDPRVELHEDVLYVPFNENGWSPGIYERGRKLIIAGADFRAIPEPKPVHERYVSSIDPDTISEVIDEPLIFGCHFVQHYGHFLLSCLSRYWAMEAIQTETPSRILILHPGAADRFFDSSYISSTLGQIRLTPQSFVSFDRPVRIARLIVPAPSFEENNIAYRAFATFCNNLGDRIVGQTIGLAGGPVYFSKSKLKSGIARIENEADFEHALERSGIEIISPETLSLAEQIALFRSRRVICGGMGSAMHTSIFSPGQNLVILNHEPSVMSNQPLIDKVNRNNTVYLYPHGDIEKLGASGNFHVNYRLSDPKRLAGEFLSFVDRAMTAHATQQ